jgi:SAM-dependent methyltransferase
VRRGSVNDFRCPACRATLALADSAGDVGDIVDSVLRCADGHTFDVRDGFADLVYPESLAASDADFKQKYDVGAEDYDVGLQWLFTVFGEDESALREHMIDLLELAAGQRVLEIGCGTGRDSAHILARIGPNGLLHAQDLSIGMLHVARRKLGTTPSIEYSLSNGSYLPFATGMFDRAYHFGGINTFGERRRAIAELTRVVKPGGKVVFGDEGVAPWLRRKRVGRILIQANPLYAHHPPIRELPETARDVRLHWVLGNAFYLVEYVVGAGPPPVDLDLPIPGPRGGTLRSRYYGDES